MDVEQTVAQMPKQLMRTRDVYKRQATLQMVETICSVAYSISEEELESLSWFKFIDMIDYPELIRYLKERRLYQNEPINTEAVSYTHLQHINTKGEKVMNSVVLKSERLLQIYSELTEGRILRKKDLAWKFNVTERSIQDVYKRQSQTIVTVVSGGFESSFYFCKII